MTVRGTAAGLFLLLLLFACLFASMPPVLDEESYLFIGGAISDNLGAPYDWWRSWQPIGDTPRSDTFVYAHPPLHLWWSAVCQRLTGSLVSLRIAVALPWLALLSGAVAYLTHTLSVRKGWAIALWLSSPIVLLGCQASLMIDLPFVALSSASVALWVRSTRQDSLSFACFIVAGLLLGLACITKYPALVLLPVLAIHARKSGNMAGYVRTVAAFLLVFGGTELWLMLQYGELHLWTVLKTATSIDRGPLFGRGFGVLVRLGVMFSPAIIFMNRRFLAPSIGALMGALGLGLIGVGDFGVVGVTSILVCCAFSGSIISTIISAANHSKRHGEGNLLLSFWAIAVLLSVILGHNYAGGRYLWPASLPIAILISNLGIFGGSGIIWKRLAVGSWGLVGILLVVGVDREARAVVSVVDSIREPDSSANYLFTGEWTFRHEMIQKGWTWLSPSGSLQVGDIVAIPSNLGGGLVPSAELDLIERIVSPEIYPFRLTDHQSDIGYHSEMLGRLPFGYSNSDWHVVDLYRVEAMVVSDPRGDQ